MIKQVLVCKRGNRLFLLRYGFGYLTTIYKFCDLELLLAKFNPFFQFRPQEEKKCIISRGLILFKIVFRLCLWSN